MAGSRRVRAKGNAAAHSGAMAQNLDPIGMAGAGDQRDVRRWDKTQASAN